MNDCPNPEHEAALAVLSSKQEQNSKRFDLLEVELRDFKRKTDRIDEKISRIETEQVKQTEQIKQITESVTDIKQSLEKKAPMPTGVTASVIAAVVSGLFMLGANIILRTLGGN